MVIHIRGRITERGKLDIELPPNLPPGEVQVTIQELDANDAPISDSELEQLLHHPPRTGAEVIAALHELGEGWTHIQESSAEWVERMRRNQRGEFTQLS
jgi:hypothetical protein